jgi:hypothetical protein
VLALGWLFVNPKHLPIHPQKPLLEPVAVEGWLAVIWAVANPTMVNVNTATATKAIITFVLLI